MNKIIAANYKMNGDVNFYGSVQKKINKLNVKDTKIILCPPFVYLPFFKGSKVFSLGAQDISNELNTKCTGQISPKMLNEFGAEYVIIGHSERRANGETDEMVANKVKLAVEFGLQPIICVGEKSKTSKLSEIENQVVTALKYIKDFSPIFAYEPVWAIGSGEIPTNERIDKALNIVRNKAKELDFDVKVLYGGSVNNGNIKELLKSTADGFLLGGISLKLDDFIALVKDVENE